MLRNWIVRSVKIGQALLSDLSCSTPDARQWLSTLPEGVSGRRFGRSMAAAPSDMLNGAAQTSRGALWEYFQAHEEGPGIWKWEHYFDLYEQALAPFRNREVTLLEIGVYSGGSLPMWREYLGSACQIWGVDIDPACKCYESERIHIAIGDQADRTFWRAFRRQVPQLDIVIDDGGHSPEQQRISFEELFPHLRPGGVYFCEDIHGTENGFFAYLAGIGSLLHHFRWTNDPAPGSQVNAVQSMIRTMTFAPYLAIVHKTLKPPQMLFSRRKGSQWQPWPPA